MKIIRFEKHGSAGVLALHEAPVPGPGEVVVRVAYAGVNFADVNLRKGAAPFEVPLPAVPGLEAAGVVEAVGDDVTSARNDDRVSCLALTNGAYAEYVRVAEAHVFAVPDAIGLDQAAAITLQGITAQYLLHGTAPLRSGTVILVHAAADGMGLLLCQWARRMGAVVLGTVSSDAKAEAARATGAAHVIRYDREDFVEAALRLTEGMGVDHVIDGVGHATFARSFDALAVGGQLAFSGWASGAPAPLDPRLLLARSTSITGLNLANAVRSREEAQGRAREVFAALEEGWLVPRIAASCRSRKRPRRTAASSRARRSGSSCSRSDRRSPRPARELTARHSTSSNEVSDPRPLATRQRAPKRDVGRLAGVPGLTEKFEMWLDEVAVDSTRIGCVL